MRNTGLYIHIPFCDGKCYYCSFYSVKRDSDKMDEYTQALIKAIDSWGEKLDREITSVYFGGGTPSVLGYERLSSVLDKVCRSFCLGRGAEITVEVNPAAKDSLDFTALRNAGFNRLSVGMQSANDSELKKLGRRHCADDVEKTVQAARNAGFDNISLDVMLAIPGQTVESLERTLNECAMLGADHISAYILKIEEGTHFYREKDKLALFNDDEQARMYELTVNGLKEFGYEQYEISNFAKPGYESRHNLLYWHDEEYLGLGPSAHSFFDGKRFFYPDSFEGFYNGSTIYEGDGGDKDEYIMLALRLTEGLSFERFKERFKEDVSTDIISKAQRLEESGLVRISPSSLSLTVKGFLVSNSVICYLLQNT